MKTILMFLMVLPCFFTSAQTLYVDPLTSGAIAGHASVINGQLNRTNDNLSLISKGQLAVTGQLLIVNDMQDRIYQGLTQVATVMNNLVSVKEIGEIGLDIVGDVEKTVALAKSDPVLLLFAEQGAREFKVRALSLGAEVGAFVLKGGKGNLMDAGERSKLLNNIATQMRMLRGTAYGMHRAMYWAKMKGLFAALNPWADWVNMDVRIANQVISEAKYLRK
ncbi:hypothetical protein EZ456_05020 [Pedobacter psychrodurus]|uniref:Uncharacterized protein n=1 Tax=Pedobacter psychrodurus TaxID=2530456 RepID=A0A4R0Q792_9SPHI|nr:hypothetical protein [Pedobacter psychrodurus]TCD28745.1 hypothetical protein EZ456_05020 [Pedobacter psychrodurus]